MKKRITALICFIQLLAVTMSIATAGEYTSLVTKEAPDFTARAVMPDNSITDLTLS